MRVTLRRLLFTGVIVISLFIMVIVCASIGLFRRQKTNTTRTPPVKRATNNISRRRKTNTTRTPPVKRGTNNISSVVESAYRRGGFWNMSLMKRMETPRPLFNFSLTPWAITCEEQTVSSTQGGPRWSMIVGVKSGSSNFERRSWIRDTWGSYKLFHGVQLQVIFVVANAPNSASELKLLEENRKNGDILQIDKEEVYKEVGLKALVAMQWVVTHCPSHWLYSSADDDMVPNLLALYKHIENYANSQPGVSILQALGTLPIICAYTLWDTQSVQRTSGKNIASYEQYPFNKYPVFCSGGFYTMPVPLSLAIFQKSRYHKYFHVDDVWITGLLRLAAVDSGEFACSDVTDDYCAISRIHVDFVKHAKEEQKFLPYWHDISIKMNEI